jgi:predicted Zn-dependent peptidase
LEIVSRIEEKFTLSMGDIPEFVPVNHKLHSQYNITTKKTEQSHLVVGFPGVSYKSNDKFKLKMLSVILGGIASSRMFSEIRERRGLAYSVRSTVGNYLDTGSIETYAGVPHSEVLEVIEAMLCEYDKIKSDLTVAELNKAKGVLYGRILIGFDDTNELANHFALNETLGKSIMSPEELIKKYESISMDDLTDMANKYFDRKKVVLSFIGPSLETSKVEQLIKK